MEFKKLNSIVEFILADISIAKQDNGTDSNLIDQFCECLRKNIIEASTVPFNMRHIDRQHKYIEAVQTVLNCYTTLLQSKCLIKFQSITIDKLIYLTSTDYNRKSDD